MRWGKRVRTIICSLRTPLALSLAVHGVLRRNMLGNATNPRADTSLLRARSHRCLPSIEVSIRVSLDHMARIWEEAGSCSTCPPTSWSIITKYCRHSCQSFLRTPAFQM
ncbi:hypothetical protein EI94DRAFT_1733648 [Lactarius quietus]|nr:hypothetical protein EI94DRAFT_1733648 [Lactarius quietus]